jgi:hypothetical protein
MTQVGYCGPTHNPLPDDALDVVGKAGRSSDRHLQAVAAVMELERERRQELREQRRLEAEVQREKERLNKERTHYPNSIQRLREAGDEEGAASLQEELDRIDDEIAQADYRAANIRAGYVYVISNIGAFGEGVLKIGMTRRLEPWTASESSVMPQCHSGSTSTPCSSAMTPLG